jgi:excisionase family DNA binding protein
MTKMMDEVALPREDSKPIILTVDDVAALLRCSSRHVRRLAAGGRIPRPIKLGVLLRWLKADVDQWISAGCPNCRKGGTR